MSSTHRRQNSTDPRPGNEGFPRVSMFSNKTSPSGPGRPRHARAPSHSQRPRPAPPRVPPITANTPNTVDSSTKKQINQTCSIAMMTSPYNPLPFCLPIPLGITMLLTGQGSSRDSPQAPRKGSA